MPETQQPRQAKTLDGAALPMEHETRFELATLTLATEPCSVSIWNPLFNGVPTVPHCAPLGTGSEKGDPLLGPYFR